MLQFHRFDPAPCAFPRPCVPVLPPLRRGDLTLQARSLGDVRHYARGRYALKAAYEQVGVGPGGALLAPAYHCRTMLDPAQRLRADVVLYPLTPSLQPDVARLRQIIRECKTPPKAILVTHFFGFPADLTAVMALCQEAGIALIEDCSHALVRDDAPLAAGSGLVMGRVGAYAVSSPYKFFPCPDGGLLWSNGPPLPPERKPAAPLRDQARGLIQAFGPRRPAPPPPAIDALAPAIESLRRDPPAPAREWIESDGTMSDDYRPADEARSCLMTSRWMMAHVHVAPVVAARRARYREWSEGLAGLPGCEALLPLPPADCAPYMFPLRVHEPKRHFTLLKRLGLPIWRWDDMAVSTCAVSQTYRQGVFHLPCHQALDDRQMAWMLAAVTHVLQRA